MNHPYLLTAGVFLVGLGFAVALVAQHRDGRDFARVCLVSGLVFGTLAFAIGCASSSTGKALNAGIVATGVSDLASTRYAMNRGAVEANPVMGQGAIRQAVVKGLGLGGIFAATAYLDHKGSKTAAQVARVIVIAMQGIVTVHNLRVVRGR